MFEEHLWARASFGELIWTRVVWFLIAWLTLFALGTLFVANPFWLEKSASAIPNYSHVMYLHGLLVGLAGIVVLIACEIFEIRSRRVRGFILFASVITTVLVGIGGIFDASQTVQWFWLSLHVVGFFSLDGIFVAFLVGLFQDLRTGSEASGSLPYWCAIISAFSLEFAALMGHAAGWILDFGDHPSFIGKWAGLVGEKVSDLSDNLTTSHSHEIVAAMLALLAAMIAWRFGYKSLVGRAKSIARLGLLLVVAGTLIVTIMYVIGGFTSIEPPTLFVSGPNGVNGLASDDLVPGIGVMLGCLLVISVLFFASRQSNHLPSSERSTLFSVASFWLMLVISVVGAGYFIEAHETMFGAGDAGAPLAMSDAVYTFAHQDFAFFLLPASLVLVLLADPLLGNRAKWISRITLIGISVAFVGILIYIFIDPGSVYGSGYAVASVGVLTILDGVIIFLKRSWEGSFTRRA